MTTSKKSKLVKRKPSVALLLIDVINDLEFEGANALLEQAVPMARKLAQFKLRVVKEGFTPSLYQRSQIRAIGGVRQGHSGSDVSA